MRDRRPPPAQDAHHLVPASLSSPLGILDVATLQFLLGPSDQAPQHHPVKGHSGNGERPASSELARAYGVDYDGGDVSPQAARRARKRNVPLIGVKRRPVALKLEPMDAPPSPLRPQRGRARHAEPREPHREKPRTTSAVVAAKPSTARTASPICSSERPRLEEATKNPVVYPSAHLRLPDDSDHVDDMHADRVGSKPTGATSELVLAGPSRRRSVPNRRCRREATMNERDDDDVALRRQVQWIHDHFPVRRLANAKCSLALRGKIFVDTMRTNLLRGSMRSALAQWQWVVAQQKHIELSKIKALDRLVAVYEHAARDQVAHRFAVWSGVVQGCREMEQHAAAVAIQQWLAWCRQRREGRQNLLALHFARAVATANENATRIQCRYRVHTAEQKHRNALRAVATIQRSVRVTKKRRLRAEEQAATRRLEELYAQLRRNEQLERLMMRSRDTLAHRIARAWRRYATWRAQLVRECVETMVDQVEFFAAVMSIQRHIRGYQCRFRMKRKLRACSRIQRAWRQHIARCHARNERKMMLLTQNMAASCLQRTFQRNQERRKYRATMQKSSRPMFMRALGASASFRVRFHVPIVKSAVSVIQSTWRRHAAYVRWNQRRDTAAHRIQRWHHGVWVLSTWQHTVRGAISAHCNARRHHAAQRLQRWLVTCTRLTVEKQRAFAARELLDMLLSVVTIQRYYRRKKDRWRGLLRDVIQRELPRYRHASERIQRCWRSYADKKRQLMALYGFDATAGGDLPRSLGLHALQEHLTRQQRELERRTRAARVIQKAYRQRLARREGRLLLKRYRLLFQRDLRRRQQRGVIHGFLAERQDARAQRQQQRELQARASPSSVVSSYYPSSLSSSPMSSSAASPRSVGINMSPTIPTPNDAQSLATLGEADADAGATSDSNANANGSPGDDPDVERCWSEEYQSFYWFDARTGESTWCS